MLFQYNSRCNDRISKDDETEATGTAGGPIPHDHHLHHFSKALKILPKTIFICVPRNTTNKKLARIHAHSTNPFQPIPSISFNKKNHVADQSTLKKKTESYTKPICISMKQLLKCFRRGIELNKRLKRSLHLRNITMRAKLDRCINNQFIIIQNALIVRYKNDCYQIRSQRIGPFTDQKKSIDLQPRNPQKPEAKRKRPKTKKKRLKLPTNEVLIQDPENYSSKRLRKQMICRTKIKERGKKKLTK